jgi:hypothetical protein
VRIANDLEPNPDYLYNGDMGQEAECTVRIGRKTAHGKALLETESLLFRGDVRLDLPFESFRGTEVKGEELVIETRGGDEYRFLLGAARATRWVRLIKEPKPLFEKLELTRESRVAVVDVRDDLFLTALRERVAGVDEGRVPEGATTIFFGTDAKDALRKVPLLRARMAPEGALWVVRPKGSAAVTEHDVFDAVREAGLKDTKVVAFSKTHTAHKCVVPLEMRGKPLKRAPFVSLPPPAPRPKAKGPKKASRAKPLARAR